VSLCMMMLICLAFVVFSDFVYFAQVVSAVVTSADAEREEVLSALVQVLFITK
jgi:hypothetical protein